MVRRSFAIGAGAVLLFVLLFAFVAPHGLRWMTRENWGANDLEDMDRAVRAYISQHHSAPPTLSSVAGGLSPQLVCKDNTCEYRRFSYRIPFRFQYMVDAPDATHPGYSLSARCLYGRGGTSFYLDETGVIRYTHEARAATRSDPPAEGMVHYDPQPQP